MRRNTIEAISGSPPVALIGVFPPPMGGQAIYNIQLASEIRRSGWSIVEIDLSPAGSSISSSKHAPTRKALIRTLMKDRFKLYHLSTSDTRTFGFELIVAAFSILRRVPFVYNLLAGRFGERTASYPLLKRLLLCVALRRAGCILVSNSNQVTQIKSLELLSNAPVRVVGCRLPVGSSPEKDPELAAFLSNGKPSIISVGAVRKTYSLPLLVQACVIMRQQGFLPNLLLITGGDSDPETAALLQEKIRHSADSVDIRMVSDIPHSRTLGAMQTADLLARPTLADGDSVSVHEAMQLGTTVVASDACPRPEGVVLHRSGDPEALASAMAKAYTDPPRKKVDTKQEDLSLVEEILSCYSTLLEPGRQNLQRTHAG